MDRFGVYVAEGNPQTWPDDNPSAWLGATSRPSPGPGTPLLKTAAGATLGMRQPCGDF